MKKILQVSLSFGLLFAAAQETGAINYPGAYLQFSQIKPDKAGKIVQGFSLQKDAATFSFQEGEVIVCQPLGKTISLIYFKGVGRFSYSPPLVAERDQLARLYKTSTLDKEFSELLLLFNDSTYQQLAAKIDIKPSPSINLDVDRVDHFLKYIRERKGRYYRTNLMKDILDEKTSGLFLAGIRTSESHPLFYEIDPMKFEEVSFMQGRSENVYGEYCDIINQFHESGEISGRGETEESDQADIAINDYNIDCSISNNLEITAKCLMQVRSQRDGQKWIEFSMAGYTFTPLSVDSVVWSNARSTEFYKDKENTILWVNSPQPLSKGQLCTLSVFYHGNVLDKYYNWVYVKSSISWYPRGGYKTKALYDVTYHYPAGYSFISVGKNLSSTTEGDVTTSRWVTSKPVRNFTFNLGFFKEYQMKEKDIPPVNILLNETARSNDQHKFMAGGQFLATGKNMKKQVGADIVNSMSFYQNVFGQCPVEELTVCESPYYGGEAFPGLVNLSTTTFQNTSQEGWDEILRAHEVAHQWWAHGVDYKSYHDRWLCEGMAQFSGLWYMQTVLKNNRLFFKHLESMRDEVMDTRKYLLSSGARAGSIWLGYRSSTSETPEDYGLVVYYKGAWVIQMLRNMMLDLNTMQEDKFVGAMRDFYQTYFGKSASTDDFRVVMEKHAGRDLGWFFKQWVYGDKIPEYRFSYTTVITPEGKCKLTYRIEQSGVLADFQMLIPLQFNFGKGQVARARVMAKGPVTQNDLLLPMKPVEVVFNPFYSVLCKQENVGWKN